MGEIGSGTGSLYPGTLDTNTSTEVNAPNAGKTKAKAEVVNDLAAAIVAVQGELGTDPAGSAATLKARLAVSLGDDGAPKDTVIVTVSGQSQSITGHKVFTSGIDTGIWGIIGSATNHTSGRTVVGTSGAMWFQGDIRTSGSIYISDTPTTPIRPDIIGSVIVSAPNFGVTYYYSFFSGGVNTVESAAQFVTPRAGLARKLNVRIRLNTLDNNAVFTLRVNGVSTSITVTVSAGQTGVFVDSTNSVSVSAEDLIVLSADTTAASSGSITIGSYSMLL